MPTILFTTVLALSVLYAPQPLLPVIMSEFDVSRSSAALLTTVCFLPLSVAPLVYGYVLESVPPRRMLRVSVFLLAISQVLFFWGPTFSFLLAVRVFQGALIPAILTALMTYVSQASGKGSVQRAMAVYVSATILGGFLGRAFSGWVATSFGWRYSFLVLAASLLLAFFLLGRLRDASSLNLSKPHPRVLLEVLRRPGFLRLYLAVFGFFLVFAAIMNFIPFRLTEISDDASEFRIGLMYSGYLMGLVTSLSAVRISGWLGGEMPALRLGLGLFALSLSGMLVSSVPVLFGVMFVFCAGMFLAHATASGLLNRCAGANKGVINGLYVSFYYAGGALGSYAPGPVYRIFGWEGMIWGLFGAALLTWLAVWKSGPTNQDPDENQASTLRRPPRGGLRSTDES
ncbi:MFS transporter, YNFM family, putative membrane transport protein [Geoalkalibacter ferrihydriticus]|uniref:MFS transporter, YNFM family, putative membrane transport protein n=1 Tax=Geoalkalibacter ferrihydriticus TaxID=392333 RepID=A0A1G9ILV2_9BACT|nr:MFS transporter [Geoalkalibacter ferrihydriticus]SDL26110.1 MFS transporter, YNFM family, putative membrane transport protein [Geoalkalibacter ferrihydriticus]